MTVKTITITEDAYNLFKRLKEKDESFSDLINRIGSERKSDVNRIFGALSKYNVEEARKKAKEIRTNLDKDLRQRLR